MQSSEELETTMEKMRILNRLADALETARHAFVQSPNHKTSLAMQNINKQREAIRRTLPKLREVA
jgi:hypothetical protein